jgi:DUF1707 SHOCT-like domain
LAVALAQRRDATVDLLCRVFAQDGLDMDELEQRLDAAHRATSLAELDRLVADLPAEGSPAPVPERSAAAAPTPAHARQRGLMLALFSGARRRGAWTPPEHLVVLATMGGAELDFREATLPGHAVTVTTVAVMGGVDIVVPPEMRVYVNGIAILGGFDHDNTGARPAADAPVLHVNGFACMGGVHVSVQLPGESARDARRRRRQERRIQRREARSDRRLRGG